MLVTLSKVFAFCLKAFSGLEILAALRLFCAEKPKTGAVSWSALFSLVSVVYSFQSVLILLFFDSGTNTSPSVFPQGKAVDGRGL